MIKVTVSPIRKVKPSSHNILIRKHINSMKIGESFDVSFNDEVSVNALRLVISRASRNKKTVVKASKKGNTLTVERIRK